MVRVKASDLGVVTAVLASDALRLFPRLGGARTMGTVLASSWVLPSAVVGSDAADACCCDLLAVAIGEFPRPVTGAGDTSRGVR